MGADRDGEHYIAMPPTPTPTPECLNDDNYVVLPDEGTPKTLSKTATPSDLSFSQQANPLGTASVASILAVQWLQPMVSLGARQVLEQRDIWPICPADSCRVVEQRFRAVYEPDKRGPFNISPVAVAFMRAFRREITVVLANTIIYIVGLSLQSYIAQAILQFLTGQVNLFHMDNGYGLLAMMTVASLMAMASLNYAFFVSSRAGVNMRSLTMDLVYQKALRLSNAARQEYTAGEVLTLMSVDAERVFNAMLQVPWIVVGPVSFVISTVLIGFLFNVVSAIGGALVLAIVCTISVRQGKYIAHVQHDLLNVIDERVKVTSEALQGIRIMKFYAWEESLARRVEKIRAVEIELLRKFHFHQVLNTVMLFLTPAFLSGVTLGIYVLINKTITIVEAFTLVAMVNISRTALIQLPMAIAALSQAQIAFRRIDAYLASDEYGSDALLTNGDTEKSNRVDLGGISIRNGEFEWPRMSRDADVVVVTTALNAEEDIEDGESVASYVALSNASYVIPETSFVVHGVTPSVASNRRQSCVSASPEGPEGFRLEGVNVEIDPGSLVMIVGKVGAGKSSLLSAILGEMALTAGRVDVRGEIAYVSQETWIRNLNVRDNILFESKYNAERYKEVLAATQLALDLNALPHGDQTEIGERGINLSGGQKARVAIARAMYRRDYDILILDDPLSAVDPHVAHAIFEQCVLGLATNKTRLLVLNSHYDLLKRADKVLVVRDGCIVGDGTYDEIVTQFPDLRTAASVEEVAAERSARNAREEEESKIEVDEAVLVQEEKTEIQPVPAVDDTVEDEEDGGRLIQDEDRVKGTVSKQIYKSYFDESGYNGLTVISGIAAAYIISQAARTVVDWWPGHWARAMAAANDSYSGTTYGLWYVGLIVVCSAMTFGRAILVTETCIRTSKNLHDELFRRVLGAPINTYFDVTPVGRILNRFSNDLDQLDSVLPREYQILAQHTAMALGSLIVSAFASYWIGVAYIPIIIVFVVTGQYFKKTSCEIKRLEGISRTPVYNLFGETLNGLQTIRAFKMQQAFQDMNKKAIDANATLYITFWSAGRWLASRLDLLSVVIIFIVTLYLVATKGQIGALTAGISLTYSLMLTSVVQWVMRSVDATESAMTSVERLLHFRQIPSEVQQQPLGDNLSRSSSHLPPEWPATGSIRFDKLCLKYRPELPLVLRGVEMQIAGGEKVGICGRTGAGKSSLMIALFRICEFDSGTVMIDGIDIQQIPLNDLRRRLAIIPQDPVLFSGSLRENLDPFGEYSDDAIWRVLEQVHMAIALRKWGAGLDFEVSESGDNLSVGQRQLICIGRALLKDSKIVVLDEATANVDSATDELIQVTIKQTFVDKTVLIIAHRINTIMHCDKIAVMDAGRVAEFGAPLELLRREESVFAALAAKAAVSPIL